MEKRVQRRRRRQIGFVLKFVFEMFFDEDDDDENDMNTSHDEKIYNFCEVTVPNMRDNTFQLHFRMKPQTFETLLQILHAADDHKPTPGRPTILLEKEAMIMIWYLANLESFRSVANRFGVTKSTCWLALYRTCKLLLKVNKERKIISWPSNPKAVKIIDEFLQRHHLPGVIGAIDGSHIPIVAPRKDHISYINRKGYHSILLQAVCDSRRCFIDVYAGQPGSIHDWTLFKKSDLCRRITNNNIAFPNNSFLIGDLAYSLSEYLIIGFKDYGFLTPRQKNFNLILSKTRAVIENAFALLKGRFRRLKGLETIRLDIIPMLVVGACILHNICIFSNDTLEDILNIDAEVDEERRNNPHNIADGEDPTDDNGGIMKRLNLMNNLPIIINQ